MNKRKLMACMLCLMMIARAAAQDAPVAKLTFDEAVKIGLQRNVLLNQQKNQLSVNQAQKLGAIGNFMPSINITGNAQRQMGQQPNTLEGGLQDLTTDYVGMQANANLVLFNGLGRIHSLAQNDKQVMAQSYQVRKSTQDVVFNVATQYLQVLLDQELHRIAEENRRAQAVLLEKITATYDLGARPITDVYTQDALVKNLEVIAIRARNTLQNDKSILAQTLQLDPAQPFEAVYPEFENAMPLDTAASLDSLIKIGLDNRADLKQLNYQMLANKHALRASTARYMPSLSAYANYGSFYYNLIDGNFKDQVTSINPSLSFGANLTIPIFSNFQTRATRAVTKMTYDNSVLNRENVEKTVKLDVQRAFNNYINAVEAYQSSLSQFKAGELALQTQQESYLLGATDQSALALANQTYVLGASSKAQAEVTLMFQKVLLDYSMGLIREDSYSK